MSFFLVLRTYSCFLVVQSLCCDTSYNLYVSLKLSSKIDESINTEYEIELADTGVLGEPRR